MGHLGETVEHDTRPASLKDVKALDIVKFWEEVGNFAGQQEGER